MRSSRTSVKIRATVVAGVAAVSLLGATLATTGAVSAGHSLKGTSVTSNGHSL